MVRRLCLQRIHWASIDVIDDLVGRLHEARLDYRAVDDPAWDEAIRLADLRRTALRMRHRRHTTVAAQIFEYLALFAVWATFCQLALSIYLLGDADPMAVGVILAVLALGLISSLWIIRYWNPWS